MRAHHLSRTVLIVLFCLLMTACWREDPTGPPLGGAASPNPPRNEIPPDRYAEVLAALQEGVGLMEQYRYLEAADKFRDVRRLAPGWIPGDINLAIALLNRGGEESEEAKQSGQQFTTRNFDEALSLLDSVLERDPDNLHAHYCRGLVLETMGPPDPDDPAPKHPQRYKAAHDDFRFVVEHDPTDAHAWSHLGATLTDPNNPSMPAGLDQAPKLIEYFEKARALNPYLVPNIYRLAMSHGWNRDREAQKELLDLFKKLNPQEEGNPEGPGDLSQAYGEMGRYSRVIELTPRDAKDETVSPPRFASPSALGVSLPEGDRWVREADFRGPLAVVARARARFGQAVSALDVDGDDRIDLYLAGAVVARGGEIRDALLLNRGDGRFDDATARLGIPTDRVSLGVAAGDFDADGHIDLFLTGVGDNRLLRNRGPGAGFEDVTDALGDSARTALSPTSRWLDIDQDGDLDLYVVNFTTKEHADAAFDGPKPPPGMANLVYRNDGTPSPPTKADSEEKGHSPPETSLAPRATDFYSRATEGLSVRFTPWEDENSAAMRGGEAAHTAIAALDADGDRDIDLVLTADGAETTLALNDRLGRFHQAVLKDIQTPSPISGLLVIDADQDGRPDLGVVPEQGRVALFRNPPPRRGEGGPRFEFWPTDAHDWTQAQVADLDLDGRPDLLGLPDPVSAPGPEWARNEGNRLAVAPLTLGPVSMAPLRGLVAADLAGDALPDLLLSRDGEGPHLARNLGNGHHWLALRLAGRWKIGRGSDGGPMRTNPQGIGTRLVVQGPGLDVAYDVTTTSAGPSQSATPIVLGMGSASEATVVRMTWPDGVMQSELNVPADQVLALREFSRKTGSCPVLFTWDGVRYVCIGDFLGGGGLGYLVSPGVYGDPDRDEAVAIAPGQLKEDQGVFALSITEPMDELAYLDHLALDVVDRPPGVEATPDERFAPGGNRPTGDLIAWRDIIEPQEATDLEGRDVSDALLARDRRTVDGFGKLRHWVGYAEEHGIVLDFGPRLARFGPSDRLVLCLDGWVEYPYSQTNYAAATAGVALQPPVLERRCDDGTWVVIEPDPGYPAGLPRMTTLDLTGKLTGPECVLRLTTNMECYWDRAFLAVALPEAGLRVSRLEVARATLGYRGYTRELSPDGNLPLIYDYDHIDPAPLARLSGLLTRYGDVVPLLREDDDRLCLVGPGDEVRIEFVATSLPLLPEGWTRSFVLRTVGYCKDADPFTAASDHVGPLPWRGMGPYPFGPEGERPSDSGHEEDRRTYQTRPVGQSERQ